MTEKVNKRKAQVEKDTNYVTTDLQSKWLARFLSVKDADNISYRHIWRKYPEIADQKLWIFICKIMNRA